MIWKKISLLGIVFGFFASFLLSWCWNSWEWTSNYSMNIYWYNLEYDNNINLEKVHLKTDDLDEIVDLYQEIWNNSDYKDSLLIARKYNQWLWANAFAQDNLDTLEEQWLTLSDIKKTQILLNKYGKEVNVVLVEYTITKWLISDLPLLYVSQLFIPDDNEMILMSFITEEKSSNLSASDMFKNIQ